MKYKICLCTGTAWLDEDIVEADNEEEALVLATIDNKGYFLEDDTDEFLNDDEWMYLDRSEYGKSNVFLYTVGLSIEELD